MTPEWRDRLARLGRGLVGLVSRAGLALLGLIRLVWWEATPRLRFALALATLIVIAAGTSSLAPSLSATANGLAVLLVAAAGFWMIASAPFRTRR